MHLAESAADALVGHRHMRARVIAVQDMLRAEGGADPAVLAPGVDDEGLKRFFGLSGLRASPAPIGPCASGFVFVMPVFTMFLPAFFILIPSAEKASYHGMAVTTSIFITMTPASPIMAWSAPKSR